MNIFIIFICIFFYAFLLFVVAFPPLPEMQDGSVRNGGNIFFMIACVLLKCLQHLYFLAVCLFFLVSMQVSECELRLTVTLTLASCNLPRVEV